VRRQLVTTIFMLAFFAGSDSFAQQAANTDLGGQIKVLQPIFLTCGTPMVFPDAIANVPVADMTAGYGGEFSSNITYTSSHQAQPAHCVAIGEPDATACITSEDGTLDLEPPRITVSGSAGNSAASGRICL
jgi:hypothetical protein